MRWNLHPGAQLKLGLMFFKVIVYKLGNMLWGEK